MKASDTIAGFPPQQLERAEAADKLASSIKALRRQGYSDRRIRRMVEEALDR